MLADGELIAGLAVDDPYRVERQHALDLIGSLQRCAVVNRTLGTHCTPAELADWPMELILAVYALASTS